MKDEAVTATYVGQVERSPEGTLWAVLYFGDLMISRERVRTLRRGRRRVTDLVLAAADTFPDGPKQTSPIHLNRFIERRSTVRRNPPAEAPPAVRHEPAFRTTVSGHGDPADVALTASTFANRPD